MVKIHDVKTYATQLSHTLHTRYPRGIHPKGGGGLAVGTGYLGLLPFP